jgi:hypothetical protein
LDEGFKIMKGLTCKEVKKLADDYSQNLLSSDLVERINSHLSACPSCQRVYEEIRDVLALLKRDRLPDPGPEFWNGLNSRVMAQVRLSRSGSMKVPWYKKVWGNPFGWPGYAWVTALILILLTPAVIYNNYYRGYKPSVAQESVENEGNWVTSTGSSMLALESLSPQEATRLEETITSEMAKDLPGQTHGLMEDDLQWNVSPVLENLTLQELDALLKKIRPSGSAGFKGGVSYVS